MSPTRPGGSDPAVGPDRTPSVAWRVGPARRRAHRQANIHRERRPPGAATAAPAVAVEEEPVKRTYQPKKQRRARRHGFRHRMATRAGRAVVRNRRQKGRAKLSA